MLTYFQHRRSHHKFRIFLQFSQNFTGRQIHVLAKSAKVNVSEINPFV